VMVTVTREGRWVSDAPVKRGTLPCAWRVMVTVT